MKNMGKYLIIPIVALLTPVLAGLGISHAIKIKDLEKKFAERGIVMQEVMHSDGLGKTFDKNPCEYDLLSLVDEAHDLGVGNLGERGKIFSEYTKQCKEEIESKHIDPAVLNTIPRDWDNETRKFIETIYLNHDREGFGKISNPSVRKLMRLDLEYYRARYPIATSELGMGVALAVKNDWVKDNKIYKNLLLRLRLKARDLETCAMDNPSGGRALACSSELQGKIWKAYDILTKAREKTGKKVIHFNVGFGEFNGKYSDFAFRRSFK